MVVTPPAAAGVWKVSVKGAWKPDGNATGCPLIVAANAAGAPAITTTGPLAVTMCDCPENSVPLKRIGPGRRVLRLDPALPR